MPTPYEILGIDIHQKEYQELNEKEKNALIRSKYRELALKTHPDKAKGPTQYSVTDLQNAYNLIKTAEKRGALSQQSPSASDIEEKIKNLMEEVKQIQERVLNESKEVANLTALSDQAQIDLKKTLEALSKTVDAAERKQLEQERLRYLEIIQETNHKIANAPQTTEILRELVARKEGQIQSLKTQFTSPQMSSQASVSKSPTKSTSEPYDTQKITTADIKKMIHDIPKMINALADSAINRITYGHFPPIEHQERVDRINKLRTECIEFMQGFESFFNKFDMVIQTSSKEGNIAQRGKIYGSSAESSPPKITSSEPRSGMQEKASPTISQESPVETEHSKFRKK